MLKWKEALADASAYVSIDDKAREEWLKVMTAQVQLAVESIVAGATSRAQENCDAARTTVTSARERLPNDADKTMVMAACVKLFLDQGEAQVAAGRSTEALVFYNSAVTLDDTDITCLAKRCEYHENLKRWSEADEDAMSIISKSKESAVGYQRRTSILKQQSQIDDAAKVLRTGISLVKDHATLLKELFELYVFDGDTKRGNGDFTAASARYTEALVVNPDGAIGLVKRGLCYRDLKQFDEARADAKAVLNIDANMLTTVDNLALLLLAKESAAEAFQDAKAALERFARDPSSTSVLPICLQFFIDAGDLEFAKEQYNEAVACYSYALALDAGNTICLAKRSDCYKNLQLWSEADADAEVIIVNNVDPTEGYLHRASVLHEQGLMTLAATVLKEALQTHQGNTALTQALYRLYVDEGDKDFIAGDFQIAMSQYTEALGVIPRSLKSLMKRSLCHVELKQFTKAEADVQAALGINANSELALIQLALIQTAKVYHTAIPYPLWC